MIDRRNHHIFQPLLYQVAAAGPFSRRDRRANPSARGEAANVTVLLAEVIGVDVASRTIEASSPGVGVRKIAFDYLVVATGMRPVTSGTTSSRDMRRGSRASTTPRRSEPKSWARSNWPQRPRTRPNARDR